MTTNPSGVPPPSLEQQISRTPSYSHTFPRLVDVGGDELSDESDFSLLGVSSGTPSVVSFSTSASDSMNQTTTHSPIRSTGSSPQHERPPNPVADSPGPPASLDTVSFIDLLSRATSRRSKGVASSATGSNNSPASPTSGGPDPKGPSVATLQHITNPAGGLSDALSIEFSPSLAVPELTSASSTHETDSYEQLDSGGGDQRPGPWPSNIWRPPRSRLYSWGWLPHIDDSPLPTPPQNTSYPSDYPILIPPFPPRKNVPSHHITWSHIDQALAGTPCRRDDADEEVDAFLRPLYSGPSSESALTSPSPPSLTSGPESVEGQNVAFDYSIASSDTETIIGRQFITNPRNQPISRGFSPPSPPLAAVALDTGSSIPPLDLETLQPVVKPDDSSRASLCSPSPQIPLSSIVSDYPGPQSQRPQMGQDDLSLANSNMGHILRPESSPSRVRFDDQADREEDPAPLQDSANDQLLPELTLNGLSEQVAQMIVSTRLMSISSLLHPSGDGDDVDQGIETPNHAHKLKSLPPGARSEGSSSPLDPTRELYSTESGASSSDKGKGKGVAVDSAYMTDMDRMWQRAIFGHPANSHLQLATQPETLSQSDLTMENVEQVSQRLRRTVVCETESEDSFTSSLDSDSERATCGRSSHSPVYTNPREPQESRTSLGRQSKLSDLFSHPELAALSTPIPRYDGPAGDFERSPPQWFTTSRSNDGPHKTDRSPTDDLYSPGKYQVIDPWEFTFSPPSKSTAATTGGSSSKPVASLRHPEIRTSPSPAPFIPPPSHGSPERTSQSKLPARFASPAPPHSPGYLRISPLPGFRERPRVRISRNSVTYPAEGSTYSTSSSASPFNPGYAGSSEQTTVHPGSNWHPRQTMFGSEIPFDQVLVPEFPLNSNTVNIAQAGPESSQGPATTDPSGVSVGVPPDHFSHLPNTFYNSRDMTPGWPPQTPWAACTVNLPAGGGSFGPQGQFQPFAIPWQPRPQTALPKGPPYGGTPFVTPMAPIMGTMSLPPGTTNLPQGTMNLPMPTGMGLPSMGPWQTPGTMYGVSPPTGPGGYFGLPTARFPPPPGYAPFGGNNMNYPNGGGMKWPGDGAPFPSPPSTHPRFSFPDSTVCFSVQNKEYRVHRHFFEQHSPFFKDMLANTPADYKYPIVLQANPIAFERLLSVFYPQNLAEPDELKTTEEWVSILDIASHWDFKQLRLRAIKELTAITTPVERIQLAQMYNVREWYLSGYREFCLRGRPVTLEEGEMLGMKTVLKIWEAETELKARPHICPGPCCSQLVESVIKAKFGIA